jgi:signal peptidase I
MIRTALLRTFDWSGRATRAEAWLFVLLITLVAQGGAAVESWLAGNSVQSPRWVYLAIAALAIPMTGVWVRRLHDMGRSGLWVVLAFFPVVNIAAVLWMLIARTNTRRDPPESPAILRLIGAVLLGLVTLLIAARAFWHPYGVPAESMKPTLLFGDYFIARFIDADDVQRGDVIAFRHPRQPTDMVKRVVGLPGETVQMLDGVLVINGQPAPQTPDGEFTEIYGPQGPSGSQPRCGNAPVGLGGLCRTDRAVETLPNGATHAVLNIQNGSFTDNGPAITIPPGQFFVLGDNRDNSADSRISPATGGVGLIPAGNIIARADRVIFSSAGSSLLMVWTWRADRYLMVIE